MYNVHLPTIYRFWIIHKYFLHTIIPEPELGNRKEEFNFE